MTLGQQTRKKRIPKPGPRYCHPKLKTKDGECLPSKMLDTIGGSLGAPKHLTKKNDPDMWLDSLNIADVMKQYEVAYPHFKFFGTNPIDFAAPDPNSNDKTKCVEEDICALNLNSLKAQGKTSLGFVYNLDPHDKGGSHWIASYTDIPGHKSYYIDSYGMKPPPQIARFLRSLTLHDPKMKLFYNERRLQYSDSECGMYCIYFLIRMLAGDSFQKFIRRRPTDKDMLRFRKWLFSNDE